MLVPLIWWLTARIGAAWAGAVLLVISLGLLLSQGITKFQTLPHHLPFFLIGMIVSFSLSQGVRGGRLAWNAAFVVAGVGFVLCIPQVALTLFGVEYPGLWKSPIHVVVLTALLGSSLLSSLARGLLGGRVGRFFGDISYSVYLLHLPLLGWLKGVEPLRSHTDLFGLVFLSALIALSALSYRFLEAPARRRINALRTPGSP